MAMSKKDFIQLADYIREHNAVNTSKVGGHVCRFTDDEIETLAKFCKSQNSSFKKDRWIGYIRGENGSSGGKVKQMSLDRIDSLNNQIMHP